MSADLIAEIEAFLAEDPAGHLQTIARKALLSRRLAAGFGAAASVTLPSDTPFARRRKLWDVTPADLRLIAEAHRAAALELTRDADALAAFAEDIETQTPRGRQITEHLTAMREESEHDEARAHEEYVIARGPGGVLSSGLPDAVARSLKRAGLLTLGEVAAASSDGRLLQVKGIGPARLELVRGALASARRDEEGAA